MQPFKEITPRQKFIRRNIVRIIYGAFAFALFWSVSKIVEIKQEKDAEVPPMVEPKNV